MTEPSQYFKGRTVQEQMDEVIGYVDQRSAEVAVNAIASDVAQVHQDMLDADADASAAAASAAAAAGTLANAVKKTGEASQSIEGDILLTTGDLGVAGDLGVTGNLGVTGSATVPTPVNNTDAANKQYVDDALDNYATMVRTANAQTVAGVKTFTSVIDGSAHGHHLGVCGPTQASSGQFYKMAEIDNLPNNEGVVFTIVAGLNGSNYAHATYRIFKAGSVLYVQCLERCYTTNYQKPKLYGIINGSGVIIYADTMSWCKPHMYLDYWEAQGEIYPNIAQHTLTLSNDWSIITPPVGVVNEVKLTSD